MRLLRRVFGGLLLAAIAAGVVAYLALRASLPTLDGELSAPGLAAGVTIERDALGVATISGATRADVAYATGYAHAQDRYFQMDLTRRMSAGRLAELVDDTALPVDRRNRIHRFEMLADALLERLPPEHRAVLEAYAAGVNAGLTALRAWPFEYLLLRQRPRPWQARDSLLAVYTMYLQLNDSRADADRQRGLLRDALPGPVFRFLYSIAPEWEAPIDGQVAAAAALPDAGSYDLRRYAAEFDDPRLAAVSSVPEQRALGSNNWAVAGDHTKHGGGIVANDMHLGLSLPNTWYRARLRVTGAASLDLNGVTLPGAPVLVAGSNRRIAWGFTNSYGDWSDLVIVGRSDDGGKYRGADGLWRPFARYSEALRSASGRVESLEVLWTEWGPLLDADGAGPGLALRWTAHDSLATNLESLELEAATDVEAALAIANRMGQPVQNFVVTDGAGRIGWTLLGRMPLRAAGYEPGVPADWTQPDTGWQGWRAPEQYPRVIDPAAGRLWSANNRVVGGDALAAIGDGSPDRGARAQQIRDRLLAIETADERDMLAIQLDDRALFLQRWRDLLLAELDAESIAGDAHRSEFRRLVEDWDPRAAADSVGYRLVRTFHEHLARQVFDALTIEARARDPQRTWRVPRQFEEAAWRLVQERPVHLLDPRHADWRSLLLAVVDQTVGDVAKRCDRPLAECPWGDQNVVSIQHPLSRAIPVLGRWLDLPRVPMGGDHDMPFVHVSGFGASQRFAVSPGREAEGYFHMPGGQSGHPTSPFYRAGHDAWVQGRPEPFLPGPTRHTLRLEP